VPTAAGSLSGKANQRSAITKWENFYLLKEKRERAHDEYNVK
jgi:hypothetical protein